MKCQEVMELMQRYLDKDLEDGEHFSLKQHVGQCAECTVLFTRLKRLSSDLESLPKVSPAFSLVDAILPRLEELDRERFEAVAMGGLSAARKEEEDAPPDKASWLSRLRERVSFKWVGGVVAAGLAIGFFIFQEQSPRFNADELLSGAQKKADSPASAAGGAPASPQLQDKKASPAGGASASSALPQAKPSEQQPQAPAAKPQESRETASVPDPAKTQADAKQPLSRENGQRLLTAPQASTPPERDLEPPAKLKSAAEAEAPPVAVQDNKAGANDATQNSLSSVPSQEQAPLTAPTAVPKPLAPGDAEKAPGAAQEDPAARGFAPAGAVSKRAGAEALNSSAMGIAAVQQDADAKTSRDGAYSAKVEDRRVVVRNSEGQAVFTSANQWKETDLVQLLGWTVDNVLTYQVTVGGSIKTFAIQPKDKTETEKTAAK